MSVISTFFRLFKAAFQNFGRNAWLAIATIVILILALTSVNLLVGVNVLLTNATRALEDKIDVTIFFKREAKPELVTQAKFFLSGLPQVASADLLQAEETLAGFKDRHAGDTQVLAALGELDENPLGATIRVKARDSADYPFIMETLKNPQFADAIESKTYDDHATAISNVQRIGERAKAIGFALIAVFAVIAVLIVFNTIRVAIYTQREEIGIMRLVGASSFFIRAPYVVQGLLLAVIALAVTAGLIALSLPSIESSLATLYGGNSGLTAFFAGNWLQLLAVEGGGLALLVAATSWLAAGKYLKR
jgi:cell division transport system permease protein